MNKGNSEGGEGKEGGCGCTCCHLCGGMSKDLKLAMLDKKEKIFRAKLEFIDDAREIVENMEDESEEEGGGE